MTVYTYLHEIPELGDFSEIVEIWKDSWARHGWDPVVADRSFFVPSEDTFYLSFHVLSLPSVNHYLYELACYQRWLTLPTTGGLMTDFDVINRGFRPEHLDTRHDLLFLHPGIVPCAVYVAPQSVTALRDMMWDYKPHEHILVNGKPHCSDQEMFRLPRNQEKITIQPEVAEFGQPGWSSSRLVHFSNSSLRAQGFTKDDLPRLAAL